MPDPSLSEKVIAVEGGLRRARIPHAFGGALALAYYATPRATIDIDVNVFVGVDRAGDVLAVLERMGAGAPTPSERTRLERDEQTRVFWGVTPIDLFFAYDPFHESCLERLRDVPFGDGQTLRILSAEDLLVFKVLFDRDKDWRDIPELLFAMADDLDVAYVGEWLDRIVGTGDPRRQRLVAAGLENG